jgi:hypothetical protein
MIDLPTGESKAGFDVRRLEIGQFIYDLVGAETVGQKIEHIANTYAHAPDARPSAALLRINSYPIHETSH